MPFEVIKLKKREKARIKHIDSILNRNTIEVCPVQAKRIAVAEEYEDESDLYIVEMTDGKILYLWDHEYNLKKNFPCLNFEIYNNEFYELIYRQINPLSEKIQPIVIDAKVKWAILTKEGLPEHLCVEDNDFDRLIERMKNFTTSKN